jgi:hypothetical protein
MAGSRRRLPGRWTAPLRRALRGQDPPRHHRTGVLWRPCQRGCGTRGRLLSAGRGQTVPAPRDATRRAHRTSGHRSTMRSEKNGPRQLGTSSIAGPPLGCVATIRQRFDVRSPQLSSPRQPPMLRSPVYPSNHSRENMTRGRRSKPSPPLIATWHTKIVHLGDLLHLIWEYGASCRKGPFGRRDSRMVTL